MQFSGTNNQVTLAFSMVIDNLVRLYQPRGSEAMATLRERWEAKRAEAGLLEPYGGGGGSSRGGRGGGYGGGRERYTPYGRNEPGGYRGGDPGRARDVHGAAAGYAGGMPAPAPVVMVPAGGAAYPQGGMGAVPTVLMQQADGTLVQMQVMTQQGGQYAIQPATPMVRSPSLLLPPLPCHVLSLTAHRVCVARRGRTDESGGGCHASVHIQPSCSCSRFWAASNRQHRGSNGSKPWTRNHVCAASICRCSGRNCTGTCAWYGHAGRSAVSTVCNADGKCGLSVVDTQCVQCAPPPPSCGCACACWQCCRPSLRGPLPA